MLSDWELWACANRLVEQHGRAAVIKAGERIFDLEAEGDEEGHRVWMAILERITILLRDKPAADEAVQ